MSVDMRVSYPDGKPDGVVSIEKDGASGHAIAFPQQLCAEVCQDSRHKILQWPCVYVLWTPGAQNQKPLVYIGESDSFAQRITLHQNKKEFWTRAVVYSDEKGYLGKTHALQIEGWLVDAAKDAQLCDLQNKQKPHQRAQNEAGAATSMRHFDDLRRFFLPLAGCDFFRPHDKATSAQKQQPATREAKAAPVAVNIADLQRPELRLLSRKKGISARGRETDMGFVVYAGSQVAKKESPVLQNSGLRHNIAIRKEMMEKNLLADDGSVYRLAENYTFTSPSTAASVILGRPSNGRAEWKDAKGRTLGTIQNESQGATAESQPPTNNPESAPIVETTWETSADADLFLKARGVMAKGRLTNDDKFLVYRGSQAKKREMPALLKYPRYVAMRDNLKEQNVLTDGGGDICHFSHDYTFNSPSEASNVILGAPSNGRVEWKDAKGRTINELEGQKK